MTNNQYYATCLVLLVLLDSPSQVLVQEIPQQKEPSPPPFKPTSSPNRWSSSPSWSILVQLLAQPLDQIWPSPISPHWCFQVPFCFNIFHGHLNSQTNDLAFAYRPHFTFLNTLRYGNYGFFMKPYGDYWRFIRKPGMTELLSIQKIEQSHGVRQEEIALFLRKVFQCAKRKQAVDVGAELMKLTNNITCRMIMSLRCSDDSNEAVRIRVSKGGL